MKFASLAQCSSLCVLLRYWIVDFGPIRAKPETCLQLTTRTAGSAVLFVLPLTDLQI